MRAAWTAFGACTSGSTGRREGGTRRAAPTTRSAGSAATTSTTAQRARRRFDDHSPDRSAPGAEFLLGCYAILDRAPKGRDEGDQVMSWLRRRDECENA